MGRMRPSILRTSLRSSSGSIIWEEPSEPASSILLSCICFSDDMLGKGKGRQSDSEAKTWHVGL